MWVTKLLISPIKKRIFCPKTTKFGPKLAFLVNLGQAMQAYSVPCRWVGWQLWRAGCISQDTYLLYGTENREEHLKKHPVIMKTETLSLSDFAHFPKFQFRRRRTTRSRLAQLARAPGGRPGTQGGEGVRKEVASPFLYFENFFFSNQKSSKETILANPSILQRTLSWVSVEELVSLPYLQLTLF